VSESRYYLRDEIVLLQRFDDEYCDFGRLSLTSLRNVVPAVGDTLTDHVFETGVGVSRVVDRFLADFWSEEDVHPRCRCWVLVVEQPEEIDNHFFGLDSILRRMREADFGYVPPDNEGFEIVDDLDRNNRDPEYWTFERKEILRKEREARLAAIRAREERERKD